MTVNFITPTQLSLIDITSMGDSVKRGDPNTLGTFDSGFKFSIALLLRAGVDIDILVKGQDFENRFRFDTYEDVCKDTGKTKNLIRVDKNGEKIKTGFALALGFNWELWMALRELWSNMLDEGGYVTENVEDIEGGTIISLSFNESNDFYKVWQEKDLYIFNPELNKSYKISEEVTAINNPEGHTRIYKQGILVYEDRDKPSKFSYNISFGEIDERRILSNIHNVANKIVSNICTTTNEEFLRLILKADFETKDKEFLTDQSYYWTATDLAHNIAFEVESKYGKVKSYSWLLSSIKKRKDCKINGRVIETVEDSLWSYSRKVSVESVPIPQSKESSFQDKLNKFYKFEVKAEVKTANLKGNKVVADKHDNCIIIDKDFDVEEDFADFIVEYIDLTEKGNVINGLSNYICNLLRVV